MKYVIILGIGAVAVGAFAYFALFGSSSDVSEQQVAERTDSAQIENEQIEAGNPLSGRGTFDQLVALGQNLECQVSYRPEGQETTVDGTYFVSNGDMRADFLVWSPELGNQVSSMIVLPEQTYVWSEIDGQTYGMSFATDMFEDPESAVADDAVVSMDEEVEYTCSAWVRVDRSIFQPPANVQFQDYSQLMQQGMEYGTVYDSEASAGIEIPDFGTIPGAPASER